VGIAGSVVLASRFLDPVRLADWLQPRLTALFERDVSIGTAEVRLLPFGFRLRDIEVADPTGLAPALARADGLELRVRLLPLLRREVSVDRISLDGLALDLRVGADSVTNFSLPDDPIDSGPPSDQPFALELRGIRIANGRISYQSVPAAISVLVDDLEASSAVRRTAAGPWVFDGVTGAGLSLTADGRTVGPVPLGLRLRP
jgi:uncharacterized protein involved in outer membrane biogenesis